MVGRADAMCRSSGSTSTASRPFGVNLHVPLDAHAASATRLGGRSAGRADAARLGVRWRRVRQCELLRIVQRGMRRSLPVRVAAPIRASALRVVSAGGGRAGIRRWRRANTQVRSARSATAQLELMPSGAMRRVAWMVTARRRRRRRLGRRRSRCAAGRVCRSLCARSGGGGGGADGSG